jgi:hypothetical protein
LAAGFADIFAGGTGVSLADGLTAGFERAGFAAGFAVRFAGFAALVDRVVRAEVDGRALAATLVLAFAFPRAAG